MTSVSLAATLPGTLISNTASASYDLPGGLTGSSRSNPVEITTVVQRSPSTITFLQYAPTDPSAVPISVPATEYSTTGDLAAPLPTGTVNPYNGAYALPATIPVVPASIFHGGQPLIIQLEDLDQNVDPGVVDHVWVRIACEATGADELVRLSEVGTDSGIFTGYVWTAITSDTTRDGVLAVTYDTNLTVTYIDSGDGQDISIDLALVDPYGYLFDTVSGAPLDGASVSLMDVTDPNNIFEAAVYDDLGNPGYPATVTTGDVDLNFPPGGYRFPLIEPGRSYRLDVIPPPGYTAPSVVDGDTLRNRFGDQYTIDDVISYNGTFVVNPGPAIKVDLPADPPETGLWLQKQSNRQQAGIGDFVPYRLTLENLDDTNLAGGVVIEDRLPAGFRYQGGSLKIDGASAPDPAIDSSGRLLSIAIGDMAAAQIIEVAYVTEVAAGAQPGDAVNIALARDILGSTSNEASATVQIKEVFFRNNVFIMGQVKVGACSETDTGKTGLANTRLYLEDGTYVVTDENGKYHFEGIEPGLHVVQLDINSLPHGYEALNCEDNNQFAKRSFSKFVDLQGGSLWVADFYVAPAPPPTGFMALKMSSRLEDQTVAYTVDIEAVGVGTSNNMLTVILPKGTSYIDGSSVRDDAPIEDPLINGPAAMFSLGDLGADQKARINFKVAVDAGLAAGEHSTKAMVLFDTPAMTNQKTNLAETAFTVHERIHKQPKEMRVTSNFPSFVAEVQEHDKEKISAALQQAPAEELIKIEIAGHTDSEPIAERSRHIYSDNQALSEARAQNTGQYIAAQLKGSADIIETSGHSKNMPVADNATADGRAMNRRTEVTIHSEQQTKAIELEESNPVSQPEQVATQGAHPEIAEGREVPEPPESSINPPALTAEWLDSVEPGYEWLWPQKGKSPALGTTQVFIKHDPKQKVVLRKGEADVHPLTFEGIKVRRDGKLAISQWRGIPLETGDNPFTVMLKDASGAIISTHDETVRLATEPVRFEVVDDYTYMVADGINEPRIAVRLFDKAGYAVRAGNAGEYHVNPPFTTSTKGGSTAGIAAQQPKFTVGSDGIALLKLSPTTMAGEAVFTLHLPDGSHEIRRWIKPAPRDWILVGFAEGTVGYNNLSGNQVSLAEACIDEHYYDDGRVKFFAKGAVKGEWLLTMAYDSDKPDLDGDSLHQAIDPDTYYPLYGDETRQRYEASSASDIYIKLEKEQAYALFGDMSTDLNQTELAQYNRSLNGIKLEQQAENYSVKAFAAETRQTFAKDEIRGDGTSGRYQLSNKDIVINSEQVVIETRGRLHSETIVELKTLKRHTDYEIDYNTGTLYFKKPIPSKDEDFNPIYIIVRYEVEGATGKNYVYGGRAAVKLADDKVEVGATYIHEDRDQGQSDLYAVDSTIELTEQFKLHVEVARTESEDAGIEAEGEAYLVELTHESQKTRAKAYYREQDEDFGLGQLNDSEEGMRKYGATVSHDLSPNISASAEVFHEDNLSTDAQRDVAEVTGTYKGKGYQLRTGARHVEDQLDDGTKQQSTQALVGVDMNTSIKGVTLSADFEQSLDNNNESQAYPTLLRVGADYKVSERVRLFADQEFTWGDENDTQATRAGVALTPWQGGTVETSVEQNINENSERLFALFGLGQNWAVNKNWSIDASLDRSQTIKEVSSDSVNGDAAPAHGTEEDFTSVSVGASYRTEDWSLENRLETRQSDSENKYGISTRVVKQVNSDVAVSAKASIFINDRKDGNDTEDGTLTLGMAYRPDDSRWIILERFDFEFENAEDFSSRRLINHLHANWYMNRKVQFSIYSGVKYVYDTIGGQSYDGVTDMHAAETRYNVNSRWDIGAHASWLHSWNGNSFDYAAGVSVGYLVRTNTWVSLGYNFKGFEDPDFSAAQYTAEGPYMRFRMKFDQESVREAAEWLNK